MDSISGETPTRLTYSIQETADLLGISKALAYRLADAGELPVVRFGRRILVNAAALQAVVGRGIAESLAPAPSADDAPGDAA